jgi:hypothetical protein
MQPKKTAFELQQVSIKHQLEFHSFMSAAFERHCEWKVLLDLFSTTTFEHSLNIIANDKFYEVLEALTFARSSFFVLRSLLRT